MKIYRLFLLLSFLVFAPPLLKGGVGLDPYDAIDSLLPSETLPRLINTIDISDFPTVDPQPLFIPTGDFTGDGNREVAISGIHTLPTSAKPYFLLIATQFKTPLVYKKLYWEEFDKPVLLHKPGTTGEGDPKDQLFSASLCYKCESGWDFYWDKKQLRIRKVPWTRKKVTEKKPVLIPAEEIPVPIVDKALHVVGGMKEVKTFVKQLKDRNGILGTRVEKEKETENGYWVLIFEKKDEKEILFKRYLVDIEKMRVVKKRKN